MRDTILCTVFLAGCAAAYWVGYRFRAFAALALLAVIGSAPVIFGAIGHFLSGGGEESSAQLSSPGIALCVLITGAIEALAVFLLIRRDNRGSTDEI
jgi:hypothetical protein